MSSHCAIVGMDLVAALGDGPDAVWARLLRGECGIRPATRFPHGKYTTDVVGEVPAALLDALRAETGADESSPAYAMAAAIAGRVARGVPGGQARLAGAHTGLVLATTKGEIGQLERLAASPGGPVDPCHNVGALARDVAEALDLSGPVLCVSNACVSGLVAIVQAARLLHRGDAELMLVVGVDVLADFMLAGFSAFNALSPTPCRPYDAARDGLSLGEGAGSLLLCLEPRPDDPVLGEVGGWGITNDACHITAPSRTGEGLAAAIRAALGAAGLRADQVDYINGHGTATVYNDAMEARAIHAVFGDDMPPLASVKGTLGHTLGAAGVLEAALSLVAMRERTVPASIGLETLGVGVPLRVLREPLELPRLDHVVSIKSGFGGVNAALVLRRGAGSR